MAGWKVGGVIRLEKQEVGGAGQIRKVGRLEGLGWQVGRLEG